MEHEENPHARIFCVQDLARICHEANRALCATQGDQTQFEWREAPTWQHESACNGVRFLLANPHAGPQASHENWLAHKKAEGWRYAEVKDPVQKTHPCMCPFAELPPEQRTKDYLFYAIVRALAPFVYASGGPRQEAISDGEQED